MDCYAGDPAAPGALPLLRRRHIHDEPDPVFHDEGLGAGESWASSCASRTPPSSPTKPSATSGRSTAPSRPRRSRSAWPPASRCWAASLLAAAPPLRSGRRWRGSASVLGSFTPVGAGQSTFSMVGEVRPGEVGTLADERVDPIDVTASVIDLAVRNHVRIEQLPRATQFAPTDWALTRRESSAALLPYEKSLLDAIAPASGVSRKLSELGPDLSAAVPTIQAELYDEVVRKGWFSARPDATRNKWARLGWIALVGRRGGVALIALTRSGYWGSSHRACGGIGLLAGRCRPGRRRVVRAGWTRRPPGTLLTQPTDQLPTGREHAELAAVLPYAVVLGGATAGSMASGRQRRDGGRLGRARLVPRPGAGVSDLPDSLRNFIRAFTGTLVAATDPHVSSRTCGSGWYSTEPHLIRADIRNRAACRPVVDTPPGPRRSAPGRAGSRRAARPRPSGSPRRRLLRSRTWPCPACRWTPSPASWPSARR